MTEQRFQVGYEKEATDEPGLVLAQDGTVELVAPGGSRSVLASNGGSLPSQWTVDEFGNLTITPSGSPEDGSNVLAIFAPEDFGLQDVVAIHPDPARPNTLIVLGTDANGEVIIRSSGPDSFARLLMTDDENGQILLDTDNGIQVSPSGIGSNFFYALSIQPNGVPQAATVIVGGVTGQTSPVLKIYGEDGNDAFRVDADGSVHIKTGGAVIADL